MREKFHMKHGFPEADFFRDYKGVSLGEYVIGRHPDNLMALGVSHGLVITLYDSETCKGGLAFILGRYFGPRNLHPDKVVDTLLAGLGTQEQDYGRLEATLVGEGQVIGAKDSPTVRKRLNDHKIRIVGEDLTSDFDRVVRLACSTGEVEAYRTLFYDRYQWYLNQA